MTAIDLRKQALNTDPKAIQQISFTANLGRTENTTKETILDFSQGTVKVL